MRIPCPFCGDRDSHEFVCRGEMPSPRPDENAGEAAFFDHVYLRDNPAGPLDEHWYHVQGCRSWIVVTRDTRSHAIIGARLARGDTE